MSFSFLNIIFAILGLGFLVFIHELGHYIVARRRGMKVEVFSIGFGKPLHKWTHQGVQWQICLLPFGGYVKIAGMQREGNQEPHEIDGGFFSKTPWERIQVALAGPLVNIAFAFLVFASIWALGGREKQFAEFSHRIGWVDPESPLYQKGVRPGDLIQKYDGKSFRGFKDLMLVSAKNSKERSVEGMKIDYLTGHKTSFNYTLPTYEDPHMRNGKFYTIGILSPAKYLIYDGNLPPGSPMEKSGIQSGDRILWVNGEPVFSMAQLSSIVNESTVFLTVERDSETFQTKVPRVHIDDLKMNSWQRGEIDDWQHEADVRGRLQDLAFIPYSLSPDARVEHRLEFIDENEQTKAFQHCQRCSYFNPLQEGDRIIAVDGQPIDTSYDLLRELQTSKVLIIVERNPALTKPVSFVQAEKEFEEGFFAQLRAMAASIGSNSPIQESGNLHLLNPVEPKQTREFFEQNEEWKREWKRSIAETKNPQQLKTLEDAQKTMILGIVPQDRVIIYNPNPSQQFSDCMSDTWRTLSGLFSGSISPKLISGPVGIVAVMQQSWLGGFKEALFWMALISLNLGIMNLLPIPVLDGGHITFGLWEMISRRRIAAKTMERLVIPFIGLLIAFFIFVTYHDISRLFSVLF